MLFKTVLVYCRLGNFPVAKFPRLCYESDWVEFSRGTFFAVVRLRSYVCGRTFAVVQNFCALNFAVQVTTAKTVKFPDRENF